MKLLGLGLLAVSSAVFLMLYPRGGQEAAIFRVPGMIVVVPLVIDVAFVAGALLTVT